MIVPSSRNNSTLACSNGFGEDDCNTRSIEYLNSMRQQDRGILKKAKASLSTKEI